VKTRATHLASENENDVDVSNFEVRCKKMMTRRQNSTSVDLGPSRGHFNIPWGRSIFRDFDREIKVIQNSDTLDLWQEFVPHHSPQLTQFLRKLNRI
jgi:hypothetical protein